MILLKPWIAVSVSAVLLAGCSANDWAQIAGAAVNGVFNSAGNPSSSGSSSSSNSCNTSTPVPEMPLPKPTSQWKYLSTGHLHNDATQFKTNGKFYYAPNSIRNVIDPDGVTTTKIVAEKLVYDRIQEKNGVRYDTEIRTRQFNCSKSTSETLNLIQYYRGQVVQEIGSGYLQMAACVNNNIDNFDIVLKLKNITCSQ